MSTRTSHASSVRGANRGRTWDLAGPEKRFLYEVERIIGAICKSPRQAIEAFVVNVKQ